MFAGVFCFSNCLLAFLLCLLRHFPSIHSRVAYSVGNLISGSIFVWLSRRVVRAGGGSFFLELLLFCCKRSAARGIGVRVVVEAMLVGCAY